MPRTAPEWITTEREGSRAQARGALVASATGARAPRRASCNAMTRAREIPIVPPASATPDTDVRRAERGWSATRAAHASRAVRAVAARGSSPVLPSLGRPAGALIIGAMLAMQVACGGGDGAAGSASEPPRALEQAPVQVATADSAAGAEEACPMSGLWRSCSVQERLERSGFVVVPVSDSVGQPGLGIPGRAYRLGSAELQLYLYADSADARRQEASLDSAAARPAEASGVLRPPAVIRSNNLLALLFNNNDRQLERVQLALTAGLPAR